MKRHFIYGAMIIALTFSASSCSRDSVIDTPVSATTQKVTINTNSTIGSIGGNTRAALGDDAVTPVWEENDAIGVIVDNNNPGMLWLSSGKDTKTGSFSGEISVSDSPQKMYFYYPAWGWDSDLGGSVDLTSQMADKPNEMVMFASCAYSQNPKFTFENKTSILKFNMAIPAGESWNIDTDLIATIYGAYSKGTLSKEGKWSNLEQEKINLTNLEAIDGYITGYALVIPGSKVKELRILVGDAGNPSKKYVTIAYTNDAATVPENNVITINKQISEALVWEPGVTTAAAVTTFFGSNKDWTIFVEEDGQMTGSDFEELRSALGAAGVSDINLTLLNQTNLPYYMADGAFSGCRALKSVSAPDVTNVGQDALCYCKNLSSVYLPKAKTLSNSVFSYCSALTSVYLPEATEMGTFLFKGCTSLSSISLPKIENVNAWAFDGCTSLASVSLLEAIEIDTWAFRDCSSLSYLYVPKVTSAEVDAFDNDTDPDADADPGNNTANIDLTVKSGSTWWDTDYWTWKSVTYVP